MIVLVVVGRARCQWVSVCLRRAGALDGRASRRDRSVRLVTVRDATVMTGNPVLRVPQRTPVDTLLVIAIERVVGGRRGERLLLDLDAETLFRPVRIAERGVTGVFLTVTSVRVECGARGARREIGKWGSYRRGTRVEVAMGFVRLLIVLMMMVLVRSRRRRYLCVVAKPSLTAGLVAIDGSRGGSFSF